MMLRAYCSITHSDSYFCHSAPRWQHAGTDLLFAFHRAADNHHIRSPNHFQDPLLDSDVSLSVRRTEKQKKRWISSDGDIQDVLLWNIVCWRLRMVMGLIQQQSSVRGLFRHVATLTSTVIFNIILDKSFQNLDSVTLLFSFIILPNVSCFQHHI